ncbi:MAG TPA: hypothetical protein VH331_14925 [Allosphingosinicella sp.]|nr:hypothetical protein [Allosphingosinicella sp.]
MSRYKAAVAALISVAVAGCSTEGRLTESGVITTRSACPAVAIPASTGDITLFNPETSRDQNAIDVVATITNVRSTCDETGNVIVTNLTFDVLGQRRDPRGARDVVLPYFAADVQGGTHVISKSIGRVGLHFADGQIRAQSSGTATSQVQRSAVTLPEDVRRQVTRERKAGDPDAAVDPLSDPKVRDAVRAATYEVLVGFQLTRDQLAYNATR